MSPGLSRARPSLAITLALLTLPLTASLAACVERPEPEECEAMAAHVVALFRDTQQGRAAEIAGEVAEARAESLAASCRENGTAPEIRCVLAATSLDQVRACAPEG